MEWNNTAIILAVRPHGEKAAIVDALSAQHGRWQGRVNAAQQGARKSWLTAGTTVQAAWRARLEEQLGQFSLEPLHQASAFVFDEPAALLAIDYLCRLTHDTTAERQPVPLLFGALEYTLSRLCHPERSEGSGVLTERTVDPSAGLRDDSLRLVIEYERKLLDALGYGLDVSSCAVTGTRENLTHISPNTGRAVCAVEAEPYKDRLLTLPAYWLDAAAPADLQQAAEVTGYFLVQHFYMPPKLLPVQRQQLLAGYGKTDSVEAC